MAHVISISDNTTCISDSAECIEGTLCPLDTLEMLDCDITVNGHSSAISFQPVMIVRLQMHRRRVHTKGDCIEPLCGDDSMMIACRSYKN